jgi:magnesium transporter
MVYYSDLIGKEVFDCNNTLLGRIKDFSFHDGKKYALITGIICSVDKKDVMVDWRYVRGLQDTVNTTSDMCIFRLYLNCTTPGLKLKEPTKPILSEIIDKQIIDVSGARVVRANDILLGKIGNKFAIIGVDTSNKGLMRRLGFSFLVNRFQEHIIMWKDVAPLSADIKSLQIKTRREEINRLHPAELADLIRDLSIQEKVMLFDSLSERKAAETLLSSQPEIQKKVFKSISLKKLAALLEAMPAHDAADILNLVPSLNKKVIKNMKPGIASKIQKMLAYNESTAGAVMSTRFISLPVDFTVGQTVARLKEIKPRTRHVFYIYLVNKKGELKGFASVRDILFSDPDVKMSKILRKDIISVGPNTPVESIFNIMEKYELLSLPVVDKEKHIIGVIRVHDMFDLVLPENIKRQRIAKDKITQEY